MKMFSKDRLMEVASRILQGAGVGAEEATIVSAELADANLVGHDSHGIIRLKQYVESIEAGNIKPSGKISLVVDFPGISVIDGGLNFGHVVVSEALEVAIKRARQNGAHTILCRNSNHVGRLGSFTRKAALKGFAALMAVNGPGAVAVAPWGGLDRRLGTNPISMAAPWGDEPVVLDMTTAATAEGKIRVASQKGESIPEGWIIDKDGSSTTNPDDFYDGGAILPLGGPLGFKGYGLSVMLDIFCGVLSGAGVARTDVPPGNNGVWLYLVDSRQVIAPEDYITWMDKGAAWVKDSRRAPGVDEILFPGEVEQRTRRERLKDGIPIPDELWRQTLQLAKRLGVSMEDSKG